MSTTADDAQIPGTEGTGRTKDRFTRISHTQDLGSQAQSILKGIYGNSSKCPEIVATHGDHIHAIHACNYFNSTCKIGITRLFQCFQLRGKRIQTVHSKENYSRRRWQNLPKYLAHARTETASVHIGARRWRFSGDGQRNEDCKLEECTTGRLLAPRRLQGNDGMVMRGPTPDPYVAEEGAPNNRRGVDSPGHVDQGTRPKQVEEVKGKA